MYAEPSEGVMYHPCGFLATIPLQILALRLSVLVRDMWKACSVCWPLCVSRYSSKSVALHHIEIRYICIYASQLHYDGFQITAILRWWCIWCFFLAFYNSWFHVCSPFYCWIMRVQTCTEVKGQLCRISILSGRDLSNDVFGLVLWPI